MNKAKQYLHERQDFIDLLRILEQESGIQSSLIEKDYWIMHVLYGLKKQGFKKKQTLKVSSYFTFF